MNSLITEIRKQLRAMGSEEIMNKSQRFFKEDIKTYGVKNPVVHKLARETYKKIDPLTKENVYAHCEVLWQSGYNEEALMACDWSYYIKKQYEPKDFEHFEKWIDAYITNWAACDTFCNHTVGAFIKKYPDHISRLKTMTTSDNRWMRRAAAVSLIVPARKGTFVEDILEIAKLLLTDTDDMVQKGYGWMLKEASKKHQQEVFDFVIKHKTTMPRTALRYAIEKMPKEFKAVAMEK
jgi:3-methyladenine DNA glycosylase AlkD